MVITYGQLKDLLIELTMQGKRKLDEPIVINGGYVEELVDKDTNEVLLKGNKRIQNTPLEL